MELQRSGMRTDLPLGETFHFLEGFELVKTTGLCREECQPEILLPRQALSSNHHSAE
jgi:hypothetical protein